MQCQVLLFVVWLMYIYTIYTFSRDICLSSILPDAAALARLRTRMIHIVKRILVKHMPFLNKTKADRHLWHEYANEMTERSEMVFVYL